MVSGVYSGLETCANGPPTHTHRLRAPRHSLRHNVPDVAVGTPGSKGQAIECTHPTPGASPLFARVLRPRRPPNAMISVDGVIKR